MKEGTHFKLKAKDWRIEEEKIEANKRGYERMEHTSIARSAPEKRFSKIRNSNTSYKNDSFYVPSRFAGRWFKSNLPEELFR